MRVHLLAVPNAPTSKAYALDGFCQRTILFVQLLKRLGHTVILYGVGPTSDGGADQHIECVSMEDYEKFVGTVPYQTLSFDGTSPLFATFNTRAASYIRDTKQPGDIIATIAGSAQQFIAEHHPDLIFLEYSIGYQGICAPYRIFQSHVWRHVIHGVTRIDAGRTFDAVIPPWFHVDDFPYTDTVGDYVLYCGRLVSSKGIRIVCNAAQAAGVKLLVIGHGNTELVTYGDYLGAVSTEERNRLMAGARAVMMPTQYLEPFGNVAAEAQLCGTPMITSDFGAFVESVDHGYTGFRCATLGEYVQAINLAPGLDRTFIRERAVSLYSEDVAAEQYAGYFRRLAVARLEGDQSLARTLILEATAPRELATA